MQKESERQETPRGTQSMNQFTARPFVRYAMVWKTGRMRSSSAPKPQSKDRVKLRKRRRRDPFLKLFSVSRPSCWEAVVLSSIAWRKSTYIHFVDTNEIQWVPEISSEKARAFIETTCSMLKTAQVTYGCFNDIGSILLLNSHWAWNNMKVQKRMFNKFALPVLPNAGWAACLDAPESLWKAQLFYCFCIHLVHEDPIVETC